MGKTKKKAEVKINQQTQILSDKDQILQYRNDLLKIDQQIFNLKQQKDIILNKLNELELKEQPIIQSKIDNIFSSSMKQENYTQFQPFENTQKSLFNCSLNNLFKVDKNIFAQNYSQDSDDDLSEINFQSYRARKTKKQSIITDKDQSFKQKLQNLKQLSQNELEQCAIHFGVNPMAKDLQSQLEMIHIYQDKNILHPVKNLDQQIINQLT